MRDLLLIALIASWVWFGIAHIDRNRTMRKLEYQIQLYKEGGGYYRDVQLRRDLNRYIRAYNEEKKWTKTSRKMKRN